MKILCVSDHIDPLIYTNSIRERFSDVDMILAAGDLPLDYLDFIVSSLNKPAFFIFGNHHLRDYTKFCGKDELCKPENADDVYFGPGAAHLGSKVMTENGVIVAGLGGCMKYNNEKNQYTEFRMKMEIAKIIPALFCNRIFRGRYLDILLTHASPRGIHDREDKCHQGFSSFLWFMRVFRPRFLVHGHIHLYDMSEVRTTRYENTTVINAYGHYLLNTEDS